MITPSIVINIICSIYSKSEDQLNNDREQCLIGIISPNKGRYRQIEG